MRYPENVTLDMHYPPCAKDPLSKTNLRWRALHYKLSAKSLQPPCHALTSGQPAQKVGSSENIGQRVLSIRLLAIPELTPKRRDSVASPRRHNSPPHVASPRLRDCATPALYCATSQHRHTKTSPHINEAMVASASGSDRR